MQVLLLLPRLLHTHASVYPMCDVTSAAIWKQHGLSHTPPPSGSARNEAEAASNEDRTGLQATAVQETEAAAEGGVCSAEHSEGTGSMDKRAGWLAVRRHVFEAGAGSNFEGIVAGLLGSSSMHDVPLLNESGQHAGKSEEGVLLDGVDLVGRVPDLGADVYQDLDL